MHEPVEQDWAQWWNARTLLGYVETSDADLADPGALSASLVFDVAPQAELLELLDAGNDWRSLAEQPYLVPTAQLTVELPLSAAKEYDEGTWHEVRLDPAIGESAALYRDLDLLPAASTRATFLDVEDAIQQQLAQAFSLASLPDTPDADMRLALGVPRGDRFAVYDVGQGNANALCRADGMPVLYYDLGGGCLWNTGTYPPRRSPPSALQFCPRPAVVLSHWDFDHWFSGSKLNSGKGNAWIAPDQTFGARTGKFAASLASAGKLRKWTGKQLTVGDVTLVRCTGGSKNDSGIALFVELGSDFLLSPGDAEFNHIPIPSAGRKPLVGLVATHHGARRLGNPVPKPSIPATLAYSFGSSNKYGHPSAYARSSYLREGWAKALETPNGHIAIPSLPLLSGCCGSCTLVLQQS